MAKKASTGSKTTASTRKKTTTASKPAAKAAKAGKSAVPAKVTSRSKPKAAASTSKVASSKVASTSKPATKSASKPAGKSKAVKPVTKVATASKSTASVKTAPRSAAKAAAVSSPKEENRFKISFSKGSGDSDREPLTEDQLRKVKTGLTRKDIAAFTKLLTDKRAQLSGDVESLRNDAKNAGSSISYEHMADTGSDSYDQEFTLGLVESGHQLLDEINDALMRIEKGYYGVCVETGQPISRERLDAKPWARYCIEVAREKERRSAPRFRA